MDFIEKKSKHERMVVDSSGAPRSLGHDYIELANPNRRAIKSICESLGLTKKQFRRNMKKYPEFKAKVMTVLND